MEPVLQPDQRNIVWVGMETDLIFNKGIDLPEFASFPLLEHDASRTMLRTYAVDLIETSARQGFGTILETATWVANLDRAKPLGYDATRLARVNKDAVSLMVEAREAAGQPDVLISANIGPRGDAYAPGTVMTADESEAYHSAQMLSLQGTEIDLVSLYTFSHSAEAIGAVNAARAAQLRCIVAFTVETDGSLPSGQSLDDAIAQTDTETAGYAAYFMVNCAHPEHFGPSLTGNPRLRGVVVNASRCSHAELDAATELDDGNPDELARQLAVIAHNNPAMSVFGGCCGTDLRHINAIARELEVRS